MKHLILYENYKENLITIINIENYETIVKIKYNGLYFIGEIFSNEDINSINTLVLSEYDFYGEMNNIALYETMVDMLDNIGCLVHVDGWLNFIKENFPEHLYYEEMREKRKNEDCLKDRERRKNFINSLEKAKDFNI
jgi:hypothetical protein